MVPLSIPDRKLAKRTVSRLLATAAAILAFFWLSVGALFAQTSNPNRELNQNTEWEIWNFYKMGKLNGQSWPDFKKAHENDDKFVQSKELEYLHAQVKSNTNIDFKFVNISKFDQAIFLLDLFRHNSAPMKYRDDSKLWKNLKQARERQITIYPDDAKGLQLGNFIKAYSIPSEIDVFKKDFPQVKISLEGQSQRDIRLTTNRPVPLVIQGPEQKFAFVTKDDRHILASSLDDPRIGNEVDQANFIAVHFNPDSIKALIQKLKAAENKRRVSAVLDLITPQTKRCQPA